MSGHRIFTTAFAKVYPLYIQKVEKKGRSRDEVDQIICWLTGYSPAQLNELIEQAVSFERFFHEAPVLNPNASHIKGVICWRLTSMA